MRDQARAIAHAVRALDRCEEARCELSLVEYYGAPSDQAARAGHLREQAVLITGKLVEVIRGLRGMEEAAIG